MKALRKIATLLVLAAIIAGCGHRHALTGDLTPQQPTSSSNSAIPSDTTTPPVLADDPSNWPTDQELLQRFLEAKAISEDGIATYEAEKAAADLLLTYPTEPGDEVKVTDLRVELINGLPYLKWHYRNPGDYNQDFLVDSDDISVLAMYFGQNTADNPRAKVADGNGDGVVNAADAVPIARYHHRKLDYYYVWYTTRIGEGLHDCIFVTDENAVSPDQDGLLEYTVRFPVDVEYGQFVIEPWCNLYTGPWSDLLTYIPGQTAPQITGVIPLTARAKEPVQLTGQFNAGMPYWVLWELGPDAVYYRPFNQCDDQPVVYFNSPGVKQCSLTVINGLGEAKYDFEVTVEQSLDAPYVKSVTPSEVLLADEYCAFTADVTGDVPIDYYWDFGGAGQNSFSLRPDPIIKLTKPGRYYASLLVTNSEGFYVYRWVITIHGEYWEIENNDTPQQATEIPRQLNFVAKGNIGPYGYDGDNEDWYKVKLFAGDKAKIQCTEETFIQAYGPDFVELPESIKDYCAVFRCEQDGYYYFKFTATDDTVEKNYSFMLDSGDQRITDDADWLDTQRLTFPLRDFTGNLILYWDDRLYDIDDHYYFRARRGDRLHLLVDLRQRDGQASYVTVTIRYSENDYPTFYDFQEDTKGQHLEIDEVLPYDGIYTFEVWRLPSFDTDLDYVINGTLSSTDPHPLYISPSNATVNWPTKFFAYAPGAEGGAYYWEFGPGASPQTSTLREPTIIFNTPGKFTGRVSITNGGPTNTTSFEYFIDDWHRKLITGTEGLARYYNSSFVVNDIGQPYLITHYGDYYYVSGGQWLRGPDFPDAGFMWENAMSVNAAGEPVAACYEGDGVALYTFSSNTWIPEVIDPGPFDSHYYSLMRMARSKNGKLGVIYIGDGIDEYGRDASVIKCTWQTAGGWSTSQIAEYYNDSYYPNIAMDSQGNPYICYRSWKSYAERSLFHVASWDGANWNDETIPQFYDQQVNVKSNCVYLDNNDNPHVLYSTYDPSEIQHAWKDGTWHNETVLKPNGHEFQSNFSIAQDSLGQPWMLVYSFVDGHDSNCDIGVLHQDGARWLYEPLILDDPDAPFADLVVDANDKPHVVYADGDTQTLIYAWKE